MLAKKMFFSAVGTSIFLGLSLLLAKVHRCEPDWALVPYLLVFIAFSVVFMLVISQLMGEGQSLGLMVKYSWYSALIFFLIASPQMYMLTNKILPLSLANKEGCPTYLGISVHGIIYFLVLLAVMFFPKDD